MATATYSPPPYTFRVGQNTPILFFIASLPE
jgi:hypothetical protein